jgi:hypothetical protein
MGRVDRIPAVTVTAAVTMAAATATAAVALGIMAVPIALTLPVPGGMTPFTPMNRRARGGNGCLMDLAIHIMASLCQSIGNIRIIRQILFE